MLSWTHGRRIKSLNDLYSPSVFGASVNLRCECGKLSGTRVIGDYCMECEVFVTDDVQKTHRQRIGRMDLAVPIRHPLSQQTYIEALPIAPIFYRRQSNGLTTALGKKYELAAIANFAAAESLGEKFAEGYMRRLQMFDLAPLQDAIDNIVGLGPGGKLEGSTIGLGRDDTLLSLIITGLATLQPDISALIRCCGVVLQFKTAV